MLRGEAESIEVLRRAVQSIEGLQEEDVLENPNRSSPGSDEQSPDHYPCHNYGPVDPKLLLSPASDLKSTNLPCKRDPLALELLPFRSDVAGQQQAHPPR